VAQAKTGEAGAEQAAAAPPLSIYGIEQAESGAKSLKESLLKALPSAIAAVAAVVFSLGFVAAVGAVVLWVRFRSLGLPADQAIAAVTRSDQLSVGAILLAQWVGIGVAAVMLVRSRDRFGNASGATRRALCDLLLVELAIAGAIVVTSAPIHGGGKILLHAVLPAVMLALAWMLARRAVRVAGTGGPQTAATTAEREAIRRAWWAQHYRRRLSAAADRLKAFRDRDVPPPTSAAAAPAAPPPAPPAGAPPGDVLAWVQNVLGIGEEAEDQPAAAGAPPAPPDPLGAELSVAVRTATREEAIYADGADAAERELVIRQADAQRDPADEDSKWWWHRPRALELFVCRVVAVLLALGAGLLTPGLWLAWLVVGAIALALAVLAIAFTTSDTRFFWTGVALFVSGLLFASLFTILRTRYSPKFQQAGVLLPAEAKGACERFVGGIFVADTGRAGRFFIGHSGMVDRPGPGTVTSVPGSDVVASEVAALATPPTTKEPDSFDDRQKVIEADLRSQRKSCGADTGASQPKPQGTTKTVTTKKTRTRRGNTTTTTTTVTTSTK
jgi:hypothetical protein